MIIYHGEVKSDADAQRIAAELYDRIEAAGGHVSFSRNFGSASTQPTVVVLLPDHEDLDAYTTEYAGELRFFAAASVQEESHEQPAQEVGDSGGADSSEAGDSEGPASEEATDVGDAI